MAEVDVRNRTSRQEEREGSQSGRGALEHRASGGAASRRGGWDPFELNPMEFLNNPFTAMRRLSDEMDRSFGRMIHQGQGGSGQRSAGWHPAIEIAERNSQLQICAELPGLNPEDVKVEVTNDALVIHGEKKYEHEGREGGTYHSERRYGQFYREIALPEGVNADQAKANFRNGVLEITLPMPRETSKRREIPIQTGSSAGSGTTGGAGTGTSTQSSGQAATGASSSGTTR